MSHAISGVLLLALLILAGLVIGMSFSSGSSKIALATDDAEELYSERRNTSINLIGLNVSSSGTRIDVDVENTGGHILSQLERMDFIVYYDSAGQNIIQRLNQVSQGLDFLNLANNEWTVELIQSDLTNPALHDPDETLEVEARIDPPCSSNELLVLIVVTENGVSDLINDTC